MTFYVFYIIFAVIIVGLVHKFILQPLVLSPLAKIPVPHWSCHISPLWILYARKNNLQNRSLHDAHLKLGPVVRIGPNELSIDGYDALKTVYQGGFEKDQCVPCMFSTLTSKPHSLRKRLISHTYSKSFIHASPAARSQAREILFTRLLPLLSAPESSQAVEVFSTFLATAMDFITAYVFGLRNGTDFIRNKAYRDHWLQLYLARATHGFWPQEMPALTAFCTRFGLGFKPYPAWVDTANAELAAWNKKLCEQASDYIHTSTMSPSAQDPADEPVVFKALVSGIEKEAATNKEYSLLYPDAGPRRNLFVASEVMDHVLAGQETAGIALTYLAHHLSLSPSLQQSLRAELQTLSPPLKFQSSGDVPLPDPRDVDALPLLHATIMETLRLHAPIPGPEPRRTPHPSACIGPFTVPPGVRVAALGHTLHRNAHAFPEPETWNHRRWLKSETSEEQRRDMNRHFWAFGSGGRMCIGSNFAMNGWIWDGSEIKLIAAAIWTNFTTHLVDDTSIEQDDTYTARPIGERLILKFELVESG
ncbi:Tryprostatin B 6-hydroxylase 3 [Colletotrichum chlorophyti]|uniref:Tryprostatin B 6-hydroxylase 3 n=1 Tax=Colletotrichum chlorophyti TaxID=708187 RepID=A0A1Q8RL95_9PEZI|nr:Tryprostatin B 6-hydroxylase 3 [Colletotrichum chlorophyti]